MLKVQERMHQTGHAFESPDRDPTEMPRDRAQTFDRARDERGCSLTAKFDRHLGIGSNNSGPSFPTFILVQRAGRARLLGSARVGRDPFWGQGGSR
jgi:hypothetical protein